MTRGQTQDERGVENDRTGDQSDNETAKHCVRLLRNKKKSTKGRLTKKPPEWASWRTVGRNLHEEDFHPKCDVHILLAMTAKRTQCRARGVIEGFDRDNIPSVPIPWIGEQAISRETWKGRNRINRPATHQRQQGTTEHLQCWRCLHSQNGGNAKLTRPPKGWDN